MSTDYGSRLVWHDTACLSLGVNERTFSSLSGHAGISNLLAPNDTALCLSSDLVRNCFLQIYHLHQLCLLLTFDRQLRLILKQLFTVLFMREIELSQEVTKANVESSAGLQLLRSWRRWRSWALQWWEAEEVWAMDTMPPQEGSRRRWSQLMHRGWHELWQLQSGRRLSAEFSYWPCRFYGDNLFCLWRKNSTKGKIRELWDGYLTKWSTTADLRKLRKQRQQEKRAIISW